MDREISVSKEGLLFAELKFAYDTQVSGNAAITYYYSHWVVPPSVDPPNPGIQVSTIFFKYTHPVKHDVIPSMEVLKEYDLLLLNEMPEGCPHPGYDAVIEYHDFHHRYSINEPLSGIVDSQADFTEGVKVLKFISANNWGLDKEHMATCLKTDAVLIAHIAEALQKEQKK